MVLLANRRSVMTLFSAPTCPFSHRTRMVLAEKGITVDIVQIEPGAQAEDLIDLNPYNTVPTLVDRDLVLYDSQLIMEYLDERFPHPPLMPVDPVSRARFRLAWYRIEHDWFSMIGDLEDRNDKKSSKARKMLRDGLAATADVFAAKPFFLSDEFSLVDCCIAPLLWRLPAYGVELPSQAKVVSQYADRIFARDSFRASLTDAEREMRD
ncbi:MAG: stringent starvation protein A [Chromatiales bacterium 21-64-14]|nr:MAG: stringent starvation protein A [Chromatiales bacterium 21-64-14]HQU14917.1 glutathione S-transferase N-terminal domain-containing protein [Gammaproteobacteria bacterium]